MEYTCPDGTGSADVLAMSNVVWDALDLRAQGDGVKAPFLSPHPGDLVSAATAARSD